MKIVYAIGILLMISCNVFRRVCFKSSLNHYEYYYIKEGKIDHDNYFVLNDSTYREYSNGKLYSISYVRWESCDNYNLIVQNLYDKNEGGIAEGDTLNVRIKSVINDTVTCLATSSNFSAEIRFLRVSKTYH